MKLFFNHLHVNKPEVFLECLRTPATVTAASSVGRLRPKMTLGNEVREIQERSTCTLAPVEAFPVIIQTIYEMLK